MIKDKAVKHMLPSLPLPAVLVQGGAFGSYAGPRENVLAQPVPKYRWRQEPRKFKLVDQGNNQLAYEISIFYKTSMTYILFSFPANI